MGKRGTQNQQCLKCKRCGGGDYTIEELSLLLVSDETRNVEDCRGKTYPEAL
ncbi:hypothetical protein Bca4012_095827 [Brassica carinata]